MGNRGLGALSSTLISGPTATRLTFRRATLVKNARGEFKPDWDTNPKTVTVAVDLQPISGARMIQIKAATGYAQAWNAIVSGEPDIQTQDRVTIDGVEAVVEAVNNWSDHTNLLLGARQA